MPKMLFGGNELYKHVSLKKQKKNTREKEKVGNVELILLYYMAKYPLDYYSFSLPAGFHTL